MTTVLNPVGYLQEICQKTNTAFPIYQEVGSSGPDHCREFTCECIFEGHSVIAKSRQKKHAKSEAASKMIALLEKDGYFNDLKRICKLEQDRKSPTITAKNPISALQEYCQGKILTPPTYFESSLAGLGAGFVCKCILGNRTTYGNGSTKKTAKTESASKMCGELDIICGENVKTEEEPHSEKNAVSALEELAAKKLSGKPVYEDRGFVLNMFEVVCNVGTQSVEGRDTTKKGAKNIAASKMLGILMQDSIRLRSYVTSKPNESKPDDLDSGIDGVSPGNWSPLNGMTPLSSSSRVNDLGILQEFDFGNLEEGDNKDDLLSFTDLDRKLESLILDDSTTEVKSVKLESLNLDDSVVEVEPSNVESSSVAVQIKLEENLPKKCLKAAPEDVTLPQSSDSLVSPNN